MKKILLMLFSFSLLVGCTLGNTPTARVEDFLYNYQTNKNINISYKDLTDDTNLTSTQIKAYEDIIKKQYKNIMYEIDDEVIDGNSATVTVSIEVSNFKEAINKYDKDNYESNRYHDLIIEELKNTKDTVTYLLGITLTKQADDTWTVDPLTQENRQKLLGIY